MHAITELEYAAGTVEHIDAVVRSGVEEHARFVPAHPGADEIFTLEWGGTCDETVSMCWDAHQKLIPLSEDWTFHEVRWSDLSQAGWGDSFEFDPSGLMNFLFTSAV